ncbi:T9SS type A sorting domain-containing protein, partial [Flavobacteriaceae bacterium]|nr:T9SS type A sorting domain-containing protein [Flavobacteriaceae bacterium]
SLESQNSVARNWNEELLEAIRNDYARPTVHARNLFHSSILMYDAWAIFDEDAETIFLGKNFGGYTTIFNGISTPVNPNEAIHEIISYAMYRFLNHRFTNSPNATISFEDFTTLFESYGYDSALTSTDYSSNSYAALGNYMAQEMISFGLQDGSNEQNDYENQYYTASNDPLLLDLYEDNSNIDPDKWQPLAFDVYIDQSGNIYPLETPDFLSPEWGKVIPFSLKTEDLTIMNNGFDSYIYNNPGSPEYIQNSPLNGIKDPYKWNFSLVISWSAHLDPANNTLIDISPSSIGNTAITSFPSSFEEYQNFYNFSDGGSIGSGHEFNPITGMAYTPQIVKRSDYARVLAEFWADGPDSETPPGHWFTILNYVSDHPQTVKKFGGQGVVLSDLEWDIKSYLVMGGAMHDSAINIWGIKGYYDYIRPISAIRYMASKGQSSDNSLSNFNSHGLPLIPDLIEVINTGDELAGDNDINVGKIKVKSWKGPDFIDNQDTDVAGVDWILGTHWWPYQRPTFVTPPFAGYLSGHSAFSRSAAVSLTKITGSQFFPGGLSTFDVLKNEFLVFEEGPSESFTLQWATFQDASDQTSLSRIWGGIHPPIDDIKGRIIGEKIGKESFDLAQQYFSGTLGNTTFLSNKNSTKVYPIPMLNTLHIRTNYLDEIKLELYSLSGKILFSTNKVNHSGSVDLKLDYLAKGIYILKGVSNNNSLVFQRKIIK